MDRLGRRLEEGMAAMGVTAGAAQTDRLIAFLFLIQKWNRLYNLTAIRDPSQAVALHLLDSLTVLARLRGERVLDVGTGAGLPGIPLAIMSPDRHFVLLDSSAKKTRFVRQAAIELGLTNVSVVTERVERFHPAERFDTILVRAFAGLAEIVVLTRKLLAPTGAILAQKGRLPDDEIAGLAGCTVRVEQLRIPGLDVERHLVEITLD